MFVYNIMISISPQKLNSSLPNLKSDHIIHFANA